MVPRIEPKHMCDCYLWTRDWLLGPDTDARASADGHLDHEGTLQGRAPGWPLRAGRDADGALPMVCLPPAGELGGSPVSSMPERERGWETRPG